MIEPVQAAAAAQALAQGAAPPSSELNAASERFSRLMEKEPDPSIYEQQHLMQQGSPATTFVRAQESVMQKTFDDVRAFGVQAPQMDMVQLAQRHIQITYEMAMMQTQFNAGVYIAQSGKSGLQTLMKNQ